MLLALTLLVPQVLFIMIVVVLMMATGTTDPIRRATDAGWRIADSQILEQRRVDASPLTPGSGTVFPGTPAEEF